MPGYRRTAQKSAPRHSSRQLRRAESCTFKHQREGADSAMSPRSRLRSSLGPVYGISMPMMNGEDVEQQNAPEHLAHGLGHVLARSSLRFARCNTDQLGTLKRKFHHHGHRRSAVAKALAKGASPAVKLATLPQNPSGAALQNAKNHFSTPMPMKTSTVVTLMAANQNSDRQKPLAERALSPNISARNRASTCRWCQGTSYHQLRGYQVDRNAHGPVAPVVPGPGRSQSLRPHTWHHRWQTKADTGMAISPRLVIVDHQADDHRRPAGHRQGRPEKSSRSRPRKGQCRWSRRWRSSTYGGFEGTVSHRCQFFAWLSLMRF